MVYTAGAVLYFPLPSWILLGSAPIHIERPGYSMVAPPSMGDFLWSPDLPAPFLLLLS